MRLALDARAQRLLRRIPRTNVYSAMEIVLLFLLAIQCARLVWAVVTPVGPLGEWRGDPGVNNLATPGPAFFEAFDPFFRIEGGGAIVVTELDLKLFGVREDRATGRGSAIIAAQNGEQTSYLVGDEIMPGVFLEAVGFDFATILRDNRPEQIFLDQSDSAAGGAQGATVAGSAASPQAPQPRVATPPIAQPQTGAQPTGAVITPGDLARETRISPRREGNRITGAVLQPMGSGEAFSAAGFRPGDVLISVNGQRIQDVGEAARFATRLGSGDALVQVERNGETISFRTRVSE